MSSETPRWNASRVTSITVVILFVAWMIDYVDRLVIATALPGIGREFGLDHSQQGLLLTAFFVTYALFQFPGGLMADKIGPKLTMFVAMVAWSAFTGLTGLATSFGMLLVIRVLFGVTEGIFPGAAMKAVTERTAPSTRMTANGIILGSNPFGAGFRRICRPGGTCRPPRPGCSPRSRSCAGRWARCSAAWRSTGSSTVGIGCSWCPASWSPAGSCC
jgi:sugar phosphate permease